MVVIMMGRKRSRQAWKIASSGGLFSSRSASSAKSIIMMAFFFTMPIRRMMPIRATTPRSLPVRSKARMAPTPAEGSVERMVNGMNVALVEHSQHDVHGDDGGQNQLGLGGK